MNNSIDVGVSFSYQGQDFNYSMTINLDEFMLQSANLPSFHFVLAKANKVDTYSYLYEVMLDSPVYYHNAQGLAEDFLHETLFDLYGFIKKWEVVKLEQNLQDIALDELGITDLKSQQGLNNALLKAYQLGINKRNE